MKNKILYKGLDLVLTYIVPIILVALRYDLFKKTNASIKLTAVGLIVVMVLVIAFWRNIVSTISKIKNPTTRKVLNVLKNCLVIAVVTIVLCISKDNIDNLIFIVISCGISISLGNCFREDYRELIKADEKEQRENEIIEAFRKAQENGD